MFFQSRILSFYASLSLCSSLLLFGCGHNTAKQPRTDLLARSGIEQSAIQLRDLLLQVHAPQLFDVSFDASSIHFSCAGRVTESPNPASGVTYIAFNCSTTTLKFTAINAIEIITPDNYMNIYGHDDQTLLSLMPKNSRQMRELVDLLASFRHELARRDNLQMAQLELRVQRRTINDRSH